MRAVSRAGQWAVSMVDHLVDDSAGQRDARTAENLVAGRADRLAEPKAALMAAMLADETVENSADWRAAWKVVSSAVPWVHHLAASTVGLMVAKKVG